MFISRTYGARSIAIAIKNKSRQYAGQVTGSHPPNTMKRFRTLRFRFALWTSLLVLVILAIFSVYVYLSLARNISTAVDNSLSLNASQVSAGLNVDNGQLVLPENLAEGTENGDAPGPGFSVRILSPQGQALQEIGPYQGLPFLAGQSFTTYKIPKTDTTVRIYTLPVYENSNLIAVIQVAQSLQDVQRTLHRLLVALLISVPALVILSGLGGYLLVTRALEPIDRITSTARQISAKDLSQRLNLPSTDDEVGRLAQTLDGMLERLEDSFRRERQFTNDASHELRTPLAAMQAILSVIREKQRKPEEYQQALDDLAEETDRLRTLIENLLRLARSDKQAPELFEAVDLSTLIDDVCDSMRPLAEAKQLSLTNHSSSDMIIWGNSDDLIRLFVNLIDNAIKYTTSGNIDLQVSSIGEKAVRVVVADTGIGISGENLPHIFDRFFRADKSRFSGGAGLGLAIAKEIVAAHHGTIDASSAIGQGTSITIQFARYHDGNVSEESPAI
jgi:heavy metal sensor kinase